jgi:hypothetical protein
MKNEITVTVPNRNGNFASAPKQLETATAKHPFRENRNRKEIRNEPRSTKII